MTAKKVFDLQREFYHEEGCRVLLILLCQPYEVLEPWWAGQLSLECIQISFPLWFNKQKCFSGERVKAFCFIVVFFWKCHNKHCNKPCKQWASPKLSLITGDSLRTLTEKGVFCLYPQRSTSCRVVSFFRGSNEVLYFFRKFLVWSHLGHLLRGSGSAGHGIIGSSLNFWVLFVLALSSESMESV